MLNEIIEKRKVVLQNSEEHKNKRNDLNKLASEQAKERNQLNAQTREFVDEAQKNKDLRDKSNEDVHRLKAERNVLNDKANALFEQIDEFKKEHGNLGNKRGMADLQKQIDQLEYNQQTQAMSHDKEKELVDI